MKIENIISLLKPLQVIESKATSFKNIHFDSRKVEKDDLFVAIKGSISDGHIYIDDVCKKAVSVIVCEEIPKNPSELVYWIKVENSAKALALISTAFYDFPSEKIKLIGVIGTNGKTTIATSLYNLTTKLGYKTGLISTVRNIIGTQAVEATHTTPDALSLNKILAQMVEQSCEFCFMEVSSHAIHQHRTTGLNFDGGVFTNITHEHLDYHNTFDEYIKVKKSFFDNLSKIAFAITNIDDRNGEVMLQNSKAQKFSYAVLRSADYKTKILETHFNGMLLNIDNTEVWTNFVGNFNASNLTAIYATAINLGFSKEEVLTGISALQLVDGRFQTINSEDGITAIVDYAHTPDAIENVLKTINEIRKVGEKLFTVVGAGGNRDKAKRPEMAQIAAKLSDRLILTSDNPRNENPEDILKDMEAGLDFQLKAKTIKITDRKEAIRTACMMAERGDVILIAGKGHETYQEIKGVKHHFDDREIVSEILKQIS